MSAAKTRRGVVQWGVIGCALFLTSAVHAEGAPGAPDPASTRDARELYEDGLRHYNVAEYDAAIDRFKRAYMLTNAPELLFDIAQAYRLEGRGHCATALQFYESYLRVQPQSPKRASVTAAIADMQACAKEERAAEPEAARPISPPATTPNAPSQEALAPSPPPPRAPRWPLVLAGAGLVVGAGGGALVVWANLRYDALVARGCAPACDPSAVDGPRTAQTVGDVMLVAGAALAVTGLVFWLTSKPSATTATAFVRDAQGGIRF